LCHSTEKSQADFLETAVSETFVCNIALYNNRKGQRSLLDGWLVGRNNPPAYNISSSLLDTSPTHFFYSENIPLFPTGHSLSHFQESNSSGNPGGAVESGSRFACPE
jgi:hypothetical protein